MILLIITSNYSQNNKELKIIYNRNNINIKNNNYNNDYINIVGLNLTFTSCHELLRYLKTKISIILT